MQITPNEAKPDPLNKKTQGPTVAPDMFARLLNEHVHQKVREVKHKDQQGIMQSQKKPVEGVDLRKEDADDEDAVQKKLDKAKKRLIRFVKGLGK